MLPKEKVSSSRGKKWIVDFHTTYLVTLSAVYTRPDFVP